MDDSFLEVVDILAREYGWTIDYIQNLGMDEISNLLKTIIKRRRNDLQLLHYVITYAMAGKQLKFDTKQEITMNEEQQLKELMTKLGKKVEKA